MTKHDEGRRAFLVGTAIGAGAAASAALVPEALAKNHPQHHAAADTPATAPMRVTAMHDHERRPWRFFQRRRYSHHHRIHRAADARRAGRCRARPMPAFSTTSISRSSGAYQDQQYFYRCGLAQLDAHCSQAYGKPFRRLAAAQQDETITALAAGQGAEFVWPTAQAFFDTLRTHTMEGMFADPVYGGNKDFAGWRLVGFPGAQPHVHAGGYAKQPSVHPRADHRPAVARKSKEG